MTARDVIERLGLGHHPAEGGFYIETYRSAERVTRAGREKSAGTAIYYLLTPETFSAMHRLPTDEVFHHYLGGPVVQLRLFPDGRGETVTLGPDLAAGQRPQVVVPAGVWQGAFLAGGDFALLGATVSPAFDFDDYGTGERDDLVRAYPSFAELIRRLTTTTFSDTR